MRKIINYITFILFLGCLPAELAGQSGDDMRKAVFITAVKDLSIGETDKAEQGFMKIVAEHKEDDAALYYLAQISASKKDFKRAIGFMEQASAIDSTNYWYKVGLASLFVSDEEYDKACRIYEDILDKNPEKTELYDTIISLYVRQKKEDKALSVLAKLESVAGKSEIIGLVKYNFIVMQCGRDSAMVYLKNFEKEISSPRIATVLGDYYISKSDDSSALIYYNKALTQDQRYIPAQFGLAETYRISGDFKNYFVNIIPFMGNQQASPSLKVEYMRQLLSNTGFVRAFYPQVDTMFSKMYEASPADTSVAYNYAIFLLQTGRSDDAMEIMETNLINNPEYKESYEQSLSLFYYLKKWDKVVEYSQKAMALYPEEYDFVQYGAVAYSELGEYKKAIGLYENMIEKEDRSDKLKLSDIYAVMGDVYHSGGDLKNAFKYYDKCLDLNPDNITALNNYAYFLSEKDRKIKKAYKMSKRVIELEPDNYTYLDTYGWILYKMGELEEAKTVLQKALAMGGDSSAVILDHYATVLYGLNEKDLAYVYWMKAEKLDPSMGIMDKVNKMKQMK